MSRLPAPGIEYVVPRATDIANIEYIVRVVNPEAHRIDVALNVPRPSAQQQFRLPDWIPGSYRIRDYSRHVVHTAASCRGEAVTLTKIDKSTWQTGACDGPLTLNYRIYAWDLSVRGAHVDTTHAYFNGACVFMEVLGQSDAAVSVDIVPPAIAMEQGWTVATSMNGSRVDAAGFGTYIAADYAELIDHPFELAQLTRIDFEVCGIPHALAIRGGGEFDAERFVADITSICEEHHKLLGTPRDLDRYLFLAMALDDAYGGLEHCWSSSLAFARSALPHMNQRDKPLADEYRKLLGLISHEYFHLWNVKRMKPEVFTPYDLAGESHTTLMWVFEGVTSYYDDLALVRSRVIDENSYLQLLGQQITRVLRVPGRRTQSLHESSFDAWTKLYQRDENAVNSIVSYYTKGSLVALALDLELRCRTETSLDDVMREAWRRYGETGRGMPEHALERLAAEVGGSNLDEFSARYIEGTEDPPLEQLLHSVGIRYATRPAEGPSDVGGKAATENFAGVWLGVTTAASCSGTLRLSSTRSDGPAQAAGISAGDELVAIDGLKVTPSSLDRLLRSYNPGAVLAVDVFRRDELLRFDLTLAEPPHDTCYLSLMNDVSNSTLQLRDAWLSTAGHR